MNLSGDEDGFALTEGQRRTAEAIRAMFRGWSLPLQAHIIWLRDFAGLEDRPSKESVLRALEAMDEVEAVRRGRG